MIFKITGLGFLSWFATFTGNGAPKQNVPTFDCWQSFDLYFSKANNAWLAMLRPGHDWPKLGFALIILLNIKLAILLGSPTK